MSESMIERVARAIKAALGEALEAKPAPGPNPGDDWTAKGGGVIDLCDVARAALEALEEPTPEMLAAVCQCDKAKTPEGCEAQHRAASSWRAMVRKALES